MHPRWAREVGPWLELGPPRSSGSWPPGAAVWLCPHPEACPFHSGDPGSRTCLSTPGLGPLHWESPGSLLGPWPGLRSHSATCWLRLPLQPGPTRQCGPPAAAHHCPPGLKGRPQSQQGSLPEGTPHRPPCRAPRGTIIQAPGPTSLHLSTSPWFWGPYLHPSPLPAAPSRPDPHPGPSPLHQGQVAGAVGPRSAGNGFLCTGRRVGQGLSTVDPRAQPESEEPLGTGGGSRRGAAWGRGVAVLCAPVEGAGGPEPPHPEVGLHMAHCCALVGVGQWGAGCPELGPQSSGAPRWHPGPVASVAISRDASPGLSPGPGPWRWPRVGCGTGGQGGCLQRTPDPSIGDKGSWLLGSGQRSCFLEPKTVGLPSPHCQRRPSPSGHLRVPLLWGRRRLYPQSPDRGGWLPRGPCHAQGDSTI